MNGAVGFHVTMLPHNEKKQLKICLDTCYKWGYYVARFVNIEFTFILNISL